MRCSQNWFSVVLMTLATTIKGLLTKDDCLSDVVWEVTFKMFLRRRSCDVSSNNNGGLPNTNEALFSDVYEASILSFKDDCLKNDGHDTQ